MCFREIKFPSERRSFVLLMVVAKRTGWWRDNGDIGTAKKRAYYWERQEAGGQDTRMSEPPRNRHMGPVTESISST
jgi:hypothetical protein